MSKLKVLVVGASIAGPSTAYWLSKAGASVTVIERFPELRKGGQNVDIRTVGVTVMRKIPGLEDAVRANKAPIEGMGLVGEDGRAYGVLKPTGDPDQQSLVSEYEIYRGDLSRILYGMTKDDPNIKYVFGEQVTTMRQNNDRNDDGPILVEFMNGHAASEFDLVVACDGATSRTRAIGLGCGVRDYFHPINGWIGFCTVQKDLLQEGKVGKVGKALNVAGGRGFGIAPDKSPGVNRIFFICKHPRNEPDTMGPLREAMKEGDDSVKKYVAERYKDVGWKCQEAIAAMMESDDFYVSEMAQVKPPALSRGRFVLVGDAGYAPGPTGTGTSLAMLGAYVLAGEVSKSKGDLSAALRGYEKTMRPMIDDLQKDPSMALAIIAPQTALGVWLRNHVFAFICWSGILGFVHKYLGEFSSTTDKHNVPDYEWEN